MRNGDILPIKTSRSAEGRRALERWIAAIAVIGLLLAAVLVVVPVVGRSPVRADQAAADTTEPPELRAAEMRAERSGVLKGYEIVY